jgi:hypothetical protein
MDSSTISRLHGQEHAGCLQWFEDHIGDKVRFRDLAADGNRLVTQFKGIFKPQWMPYVLSIRTTEQDKYADGKILREAAGSWRMSYAQEISGQSDPRELYTNRGIEGCINDRIPIGILRKERREDPYEVVGLGLPVEWKNGFFNFVAYRPGLVQLSGSSGAVDQHGRQEPLPGDRDAASAATLAMVLEAVRHLHVQRGPDDLPKRHQPLTLLWAIGRARQGQPRLADWPIAEVQIGSLISRFGRNTDARNPHLPFLALGSSGLWQLTAQPPPKGRSGDARLAWLNNAVPPIEGGLTERVHNLMVDDDEAASDTVAAILAEYFNADDPDGMLQAVGLGALITGLARHAGPQSEATTPGTRTGRIADALLRAAIEKHAVDQVMKHYRQLGYTVTDVGATESYDVLAIRDGQTLHVEVKGSMGTASDVELTVNEVTHARAETPTDLVVVDGIKWSRLSDGTIRTSGGRYRTWATWQPAEKDLKASRYRYRLPS